MVGQTDINTCIVSELNNPNIHVRIRVKAKLEVNLLKNCLIQDNVYGHTYIFELDYRVASLIILFFDVPEINVPKNQIKRIIRSHKILLLKK